MVDSQAAAGDTIEDHAGEDTTTTFMCFLQYSSGERRPVDSNECSVMSMNRYGTHSDDPSG